MTKFSFQNNLFQGWSIRYTNFCFCIIFFAFCLFRQTFPRFEVFLLTCFSASYLFSPLDVRVLKHTCGQSQIFAATIRFHRVKTLMNSWLKFLVDCENAKIFEKCRRFANCISVIQTMDFPILKDNLNC